MKKLLLGFLTLIMMLSMSACMSIQEQMAQKYQKGEEYFSQQNYRWALHDLLPVARYGDPNAEYAVGYMYFYGKGTIENRPYAKYWFQRAAAQGNQRAIQTLAIISHPDAVDQRCKPYYHDQPCPKN